MNQYKTDRDKELVSFVPEVITCENYCKWYSLYYITEDGDVKELHELYKDFFDKVEMKDHSYQPKSLVDFAIEHNLRIGSDSYKAICHMYAEYVSDKNAIDPMELPTKEELQSVLVNDDGDWSKCFSYGLDISNFRYYRDEDINYKKFNPIRLSSVDVYRVNANMFEVYVSSENGTGASYHVSTLDQVGDVIQTYISEYVLCDNITDPVFSWEEDNDVLYDIDESSMYDTKMIQADIFNSYDFSMFHDIKGDTMDKFTHDLIHVIQDPFNKSPKHDNIKYEREFLKNLNKKFNRWSDLDDRTDKEIHDLYVAVTYDGYDMVSDMYKDSDK